MLAQVFVLVTLAYVASANDDITYNPVETWDCGGSDKVITFSGTTLNPAPILYPGMSLSRNVFNKYI